MRKYRTLRRSPWHVSSRKILDWLFPLLQPWPKYRLGEHVDLAFLSLRPPDALPPDFADLWFLYKAVRRRKPRIILEFGSGCSTVVMAQALYDNFRESPETGGVLHSLESEQQWYEVTTRTIPEHLQAMQQLWCSSVRAVRYRGMSVFRYTNWAEAYLLVPPDFIYLDGPALTSEVQVAVDVLDMEESFRKGFFMVVDGRWENTLFLREHLRKGYIFRHRGLFFNSTFELC